MLEPEMSDRGTWPSAEFIDMTWRFRIGLASALPIFGHEIGGHLFDLHALTAPQTSNFIQSAHALASLRAEQEELVNQLEVERLKGQSLQDQRLKHGGIAGQEKMQKIPCC